MTDRQYQELFAAILDLRNATELGFNAVNHRFEEMDRRFDALEERWEHHFDALEERWERRFTALETRVEDGFRETAASLARIDSRLSVVERR